MFVMRFVRTDGVVTGPLAIVETLAELKRSFVKCGSDRHEWWLYPRLAAFVRASDYKYAYDSSASCITQTKHDAKVRRRRDWRRTQRSGERCVSRARGQKSARSRAPSRARRRCGDRRSLSRVQVFCLFLRRFTTQAGNHSRTRSATTRVGNTSARRHVHAD